MHGKQRWRRERTKRDTFQGTVLDKKRLIAQRSAVSTIQVQFVGEDKEVRPEEVSSVALTGMKETIEAFLGSKVNDAAMTVSTCLNDPQGQPTQVHRVLSVFH